MKDLIAKLQAAEKPDRELDLAIQLAIEPDGRIAELTKYRRGLDSAEGYSWDILHEAAVYQHHNADGRCYINGGYPLPRYTSSIDGALTLMRPHYLWDLKRGHTCRAIVWWLERDWDDEGGPTGTSAGNPALALTIATLIARATEDRII